MNVVRGQRSAFIDYIGTSFDVDIDVQRVDRASWRFLCLLLGDHDRVIDGGEVLFDETQRSRCGTVVPRSRDGKTSTFRVDLSRASTALKSVVFALIFVTPAAGGRTTAKQLAASVIQIKSPHGKTISYTFSGADFDQETAIVLLEVYRKDPWRMMAVGSGYLGGAPAMLHRYGVSNDVVQSLERGTVPLVQAATDALRLPSGWPGGIAPKIPSGLLPAVGMVLVQDSEGNAGFGTAFAISPGGFLITCAHVTNNALHIGVVMEGKTSIRPADVVAADTRLDVALLLLADRNGLERWFTLCAEEATIEVGQEVGILGYPLGSSLGMNVTYSHGIVNSLRRRPENQTQVLQVDAGAAPGSSGAPVFNRAGGTVLGILSSGLSLGSGMLVNFAVDLRSVMRLGWFEG